MDTGAKMYTAVIVVFFELCYDRRMKKRTFLFSLTQSFYWFGACLAYSYGERLLLSHGFSTGRIGVILAAAYLSAMALQPMLAAAADREKRVTLRTAIVSCAALGALLAGAALLCTDALPVFAVLFGALTSVTLVVQPLINAVGFHYTNRGLDLDYSFARGTASVMYALASLLLGALAKKSADAMLWLYIAAQIGLFAVSLFFAPHRTEPRPEIDAGGSLLRVFKRSPAFVLFCVGNFVLVIPHTFLNAYLASITKVTGGDMSVMIAVAAIVEFPAMMAYSHIRKRVPDRIMLVLSASVYLLKTGLLLLAALFPIGAWAVYVSSALQMLCYALFIPAASYYANDAVSESDRVKGQMLLTEAQLSAGVVSMLLGGFAIEGLGIAATLAVCEGLVAAGVLIVWLGLRKRKENTGA
jgi:PPP family 3-phenylpropionic acid transporter